MASQVHDVGPGCSDCFGHSLSRIVGSDHDSCCRTCPRGLGHYLAFRLIRAHRLVTTSGRCLWSGRQISEKRAKQLEVRWRERFRVLFRATGTNTQPRQQWRLRDRIFNTLSAAPRSPQKTGMNVQLVADPG